MTSRNLRRFFKMSPAKNDNCQHVALIWSKVIHRLPPPHNNSVGRGRGGWRYLDEYEQMGCAPSHLRRHRSSMYPKATKRRTDDRQIVALTQTRQLLLLFPLRQQDGEQ